IVVTSTALLLDVWILVQRLLRSVTMKFASGIILLLLFITRAAFGTELDFRINYAKTKSGQYVTHEMIKDVRLAMTDEGKVDVAELELLNGAVLKRSDLDAIILVGNTPLEQISDSNEQSSVWDRTVFMVIHAGRIVRIGCP